MGIIGALDAAGVLAAFAHPNHLLMLAHRDEFTGCLPATPIALGIIGALDAAGVLAAFAHPNHLLM
ncbi:hypothetical protein A6J65_017720 [Yersinia enterocolitica]|nr:hypothetical protein A6J65_017720 [Yersinia enterocolitica]